MLEFAANFGFEKRANTQERTMQIEDNRVVSLVYTLKDNDDNVIDQSSDGSFCYLHGASNIIPGLENALAGKAGAAAIPCGSATEARSRVVPDLVEGNAK